MALEYNLDTTIKELYDWGRISIFDLVKDSPRGYGKKRKRDSLITTKQHERKDDIRNVEWSFL